MAVTAALVATALGRPSPSSGSAEEGQWLMWIDDALMLIDARLGDVTVLDQAKLDYVVREAVVAQVRRPDDATQVAISVDDGSVSRTYRSAKGRVEILDEWWDLLSPTPEDAGKAFSVDTAPRTRGPHAPWCSVMFNSEATCSCGVALTGYAPIYEPDE